jgi:hypothetical protein
LSALLWTFLSRPIAQNCLKRVGTNFPLMVAILSLRNIDFQYQTSVMRMYHLIKERLSDFYVEPFLLFID